MILGVLGLADPTRRKAAIANIQPNAVSHVIIVRILFRFVGAFRATAHTPHLLVRTTGNGFYANLLLGASIHLF